MLVFMNITDKVRILSIQRLIFYTMNGFYDTIPIGYYKSIYIYPFIFHSFQNMDEKT